MSKLTPTTIIMLIAGLGAGVFLFFYFRKKKENETPAATIEEATKPAPAETSNGFAPMRLVPTPVGYVKAG